MSLFPVDPLYTFILDISPYAVNARMAVLFGIVACGCYDSSCS